MHSYNRYARNSGTVQRKVGHMATVSFTHELSSELPAQVPTQIVSLEFPCPHPSAIRRR